MNDWVPIIVETLLLIPFFGWGVYTIYLRFNRRAESTILADGVTILVLVAFLAFQVHYLGIWRRSYPIEYMLAVLGLFAATAALYGHVVYTLATQIMMEIAHPTRDDSSVEPRWGAAEAHERIDDYPGALAEYLKLLRKHPRHVLLNVRIAETLVQVERPVEAPPYFRMALDSATSPDRQLAVVNRLCDLYVGVLGAPEKAERCLDDFLERNPRGPQADTARRRRERLELEMEPPPVPPLDSLDIHPVEDQPDDEFMPLDDETEHESLESLEEHPLYAAEEPEEVSDDLSDGDETPEPLREGLTTLDAEPIEDEETSESEGFPEAPGQDEESAIERM